MKRYLVYSFDYDTRSILLEPPQSVWDDQIKNLHHQNAQIVSVELAAEYGLIDANRKRKDFLEFGRRPFCMIGLYSSIIREIQGTFVSGNYYASLTTACTLGELIFNVLLERLWPYFNEGAAMPKRVQNWEKGVAKLRQWGVVSDQLECSFLELKKLRTLAVHFVGFEVETLRDRALEARKISIDIATTLFGVDGGRPWMMKGVAGATFVSKAFEGDPFVREFVIPNSFHVGPFYRISLSAGRMQIVDHPEYSLSEISDEDFAKAYATRSEENMPPHTVAVPN